MTRTEKQRTISRKTFVLWFTGLPSSGKSTLADAVSMELKKYNISFKKIDGDIIRRTISKDLGFSKKDIEENAKRATSLAKSFTEKKICVLASIISPYKNTREQTRREIGKEFIEVYTKCDPAICIQRDVKGLYKKALRGEIKNFIGVSIQYQEPDNPEIVIETDKETVTQSVRKILRYLTRKQYIA
jgi:adenylylsulfate kinase